MRKIVPWQNSETRPHRPELSDSNSVLEPEIRAFLRAWWPALLWAGFIFVMSTDAFSSEHTKWFFEPIIRWFDRSLNAEQVEWIHHYIRKSAHFIEYFVFCTLLYRGIRGRNRGWGWFWALCAWFIAAAYSALDEVHQIFVASRQARAADSLLDSVGALFGIVVLYLWFRYRPPQPGTAASSGVATPSPTPD